MKRRFSDSRDNHPQHSKRNKNNHVNGSLGWPGLNYRTFSNQERLNFQWLGNRHLPQPHQYQQLHQYRPIHHQHYQWGYQSQEYQTKTHGKQQQPSQNKPGPNQSQLNQEQSLVEPKLYGFKSEFSSINPNVESTSRVVAEAEKSPGIFHDAFTDSQNRIASLQVLDQDHGILTQGESFDASDRLSKSVWLFYVNQYQDKKTLKRKISVWKNIDSVLSRRWTDSRVLAFGSTLNGFGSNSSDMDLCVFSEAVWNESASMGKKKSQAQESKFLVKVRKELRRYCAKILSPEMELIPAKVPILKFSGFLDGKIQIDLSCNSKNGALNTNLLYCYSKLDWRVRPLVLVIKEWAKNCDVNDAKNNTFSSYALTLLVLNFLQCGVSPPVLPSLQDMYPETFHFEANIFTLPYITELPKFVSQNEKSLGELLTSFFDYYVNKFDFTQDVASVRCAKVLSNADCEKYARDYGTAPRQWDAYICVEEPFDRTNAARSVINRDAFDKILDSLRKSVATIESESNLRVNDIIGN